jgi:signal transduction histidine kinase
VVYIIVILGLGNPPQDSSDHELLGLWMVAAAVGAMGYLPVRERLIRWVTRSVFGARQAPDEVLRTFGSRMTRAISMDELLLQLAESLRKTMNLTSAEVFTGMGDVLERAAAVPETGQDGSENRPTSLVITSRERPVVTRAGISGNAWVSVWLPALLEGRGDCQLRVMPVSHAGQLLGLIVAQRPSSGDAFSAEDDRVLAELARQVGLAVHNARLDTALQTTLDELRKQADELRESRARVVASGDAERRRVERNLHDGAQQHLVAMAVNLRLARDILADDPRAATEMLDQLANDIKDTITELRELAHGIYPPLLADRGLGEALRAAANRSPLEVTVRAAGIDRYGPEVEAAILFLLPGGPAERRQARCGIPGRGSDLGGRGRAALLGKRQRSWVHPGSGAQRSRVRQHGSLRPAAAARCSAQFSSADVILLAKRPGTPGLSPGLASLADDLLLAQVHEHGLHPAVDVLLLG